MQPRENSGVNIVNESIEWVMRVASPWGHLLAHSIKCFSSVLGPAIILPSDDPRTWLSTEFDFLDAFIFTQSF